MPVVVDDHLLIDLLAESAPPWLASEAQRSAVYTTTAWYYRVAMAAHRASGSGRLSRHLRGIDASLVDELPDWIGLLNPRSLIPVMATLPTRRRPNFLVAESLAVALVTQATIAISVDTPLLRTGAADLDITYQLVRNHQPPQ